MTAPVSDTDSKLAEALGELAQLRSENDRLRDELQRTRGPAPVAGASPTQTNEDRHTGALSPAQKVALFRSLFKGRTEVYPLRWENRAGKSGYSPACGNEWRAGVCEKPRIKCSDCPNQMFLHVDFPPDQGGHDGSYGETTSLQCSGLLSAPRPATDATAASSTAGSTGLEICMTNPA